MFPHEEHLYLTPASLLASSSPSVPPSAGERSFSTRSVSPAKESREALPRGRQHSHTAGFSCHHEVFRCCWQLPPLLLQPCRAAVPPSRPPSTAASQPTASEYFHSHWATVTSSWECWQIRAQPWCRWRDHCSVSERFLLPCLGETGQRFQATRLFKPAGPRWTHIAEVTRCTEERLFLWKLWDLLIGPLSIKPAPWEPGAKQNHEPLPPFTGIPGHLLPPAQLHTVAVLHCQWLLGG